MRVLNWNLEFAPLAGARGRAIAGVIEGEAADVVCLAETHVTWPLGGGQWIWSEADYGYDQRGDRRKVVDGRRVSDHDGVVVDVLTA